MGGQNIVQIKKLNQSLILRTLLENGPLSRTSIGELTKLTPATITAQVSELIDNGIVAETGLISQTSGAGRPLILLDLVEDSRMALGIELGVSSIHLGLVNLKGRLLTQREWPYLSTDSQEVLEAFPSYCQTFLHDLYVPPSQLIGIGISVSGVVDATHGIIRRFPALHWEELHITELLKEKLPQLAIENNVRLMALREKLYGLGRNSQNLILIHIGHGIGCGMILEGQIYHGMADGAGELGHITVKPNGLLCTCGKRGCLETMAGGWGMIREAQTQIHNGVHSVLSKNALITPEVIFNSARAGDELAMNIVKTAIEQIGYAMSTIINLLNPELLVLSGTIWNDRPFCLAILKPILEQTILDGAQVLERIRFASFDPKTAALIGSGVLALQKFFYEPIPD